MNDLPLAFWDRVGATAIHMPANRYRGWPMTPANMRAQGVRSLWVVCKLCHHEAVLNVDRYGDAVPVPAFGPRMACSAWRIIGAHARPNSRERPTTESLTGAVGGIKGAPSLLPCGGT
jgi:hypothetical protein